MGTAIRWIAAIVAGFVAALILSLAAGALLINLLGCMEPGSDAATWGCVATLRLLPLAFVLAWIALSIFLSRIFRSNVL